MTESTAVSSAVLNGYGRLHWARARQLLVGCACTWTDVSGIHLTDAPPQQYPVGATHLWAWSPTSPRLARVRFDGDEAVYVAVLDDRGAREARTTEAVTTHQREAVMRRPDDKRSGLLPEAVRAQQWTLTEVTGEAPLVFVRARPGR